MHKSSSARSSAAIGAILKFCQPRISTHATFDRAWHPTLPEQARRDSLGGETMTNKKQAPSSRSWLLLVLAAMLILGPLAIAKEAETSSSSHDRTPKLVVGLVVDQMRLDTLYRFWNHFGDGGF